MQGGEKQKGLMTVSHKPLKNMVVRLNNFSLNILKLQHKINLKNLDTNKNTNNFFWCPTGWGNAKIMGVNKNLANFSGLITPTNLFAILKVFPPEKFPISLQMSVAFLSILTKIHSLKRISGLRDLAFALAFGSPLQF